MIAVVLVGGTGTRLRPLTLDRPKPMLPIAGRPFLAHLLERLAAGGVDRVIFSCGYLPDQIRATFGDGAAGWPRLEYVVEDEPLGTAGAIRHAALDRVDEPFLALNGDVLSELDVRALRRFHDERGSRATIALTPVADPTRYGLVVTDGHGRVEAFAEKPGPDELGRLLPPYRINAGAYVLDPEVLERIPAGRAVSIERETFPQLIGAGLHAWPSAGYWNDIGTPESYLTANRHVLAAEAGAGALVDPSATVAGDAVLLAEVRVGAGVEVGRRARVGPGTVLGTAARVGDDASVAGSVLHEGAVVGARARVVDSVVGTGAEIGTDAEVRDLSVLGPGVVVSAGAVVVAERRATETAPAVPR